jgi:hypothetical protein
VIECLLSKHKPQSSNPSTTKRKDVWLPDQISWHSWGLHLHKYCSLSKYRALEDLIVNTSLIVKKKPGKLPSVFKIFRSIRIYMYPPEHMDIHGEISSCSNFISLHLFFQDFYSSRLAYLLVIWESVMLCTFQKNWVLHLTWSFIWH